MAGEPKLDGELEHGGNSSVGGDHPEPIDDEARITQPVLVDDGIASRPVFRRLTRALSDEEMTSPAVVKMMMEILARTEERAKSLERYEALFHEADKENCRLQGKLALHLGNELVYLGCVSASSIMVGKALADGMKSEAGPFTLIMGLIVLLVGLAAKIVKTK